jgi:hypothetical protein
MIAKPKRKKSKRNSNNILLSLTLVPMVIGLLLIGAWAIDIYIFNVPETQTLTGMLFILFSFAASNILQKKTRLAVGWSFLTVADVVLLLWVELWAQIVAIILGVVGVGIILYEFYHRWQEERSKAKK